MSSRHYRGFALFIVGLILCLIPATSFAIEAVPASLGDFVWEDLNANGLQDVGELGVADVTVQLWQMGAVDILVASTATDAYGHYTFNDVPSSDSVMADYYIKFLLPAGYLFSPQDQGADDGIDSDAYLTTGMTDSITAISGQTDMTWDAGIYDDPTYEPITYDICGYKTDSRTQMGLAGWEITLYRDEDRDADTKDDLTWLRVTTTRSDGLYCFHDLPEGLYALRETPQANWEQVFPLGSADQYAWFPGAAPSNCEDPGAPGSSLWNFSNRYTLSDICGYKTDARTQLGLAGWEINLYWDEDGDAETKDDLIWQASDMTDENGLYCFHDVPYGLYALRETPQANWEQVFPLGSADQYAWFPGAAPSNCEDPGAPGSSLWNFSNRYTLSDICGYKTDADTQLGLAGWQIDLYWDEDADAETKDDLILQASAVTDENGLYCFHDVPYGLYALRETPQANWEQVFPPGGADQYAWFPGAAPSNCEDPGAPGSSLWNFSNRYTLSDVCGYKTDADTQSGLAGWEINLYWDEDGDAATKDDLIWQASDMTDENGLYCFHDVPYGLYALRETPQPGWEQVFPPGGADQYAWFPGAAPSNCADPGAPGSSLWNFSNRHIRYDICGYKFYDFEWGTGLAGWEIQLWNYGEPTTDSDDVMISTFTDASGKYCFPDIILGNYVLKEVPQSGWVASYPSPDGHLITLPGDESDGNEGPFHNFVNERRIYCLGETAWAAQDGPGTTRFVKKGDWATYLSYEIGSGTETQPALLDLYAGQTHLAGHLSAYDDGERLYFRYVADGTDPTPGEGFDGTWTIAEYHLQVVDDLADFNPYRVYNKNKDYGAPIPGQFEWSECYNPPVPATQYRSVNITDLFDQDDTSLLIAAHTSMRWCEYSVEEPISPEQIDEFTVPATAGLVPFGAYSNISLDSGEAYVLVVSGTWQNRAVEMVDAMYSSYDGGAWATAPHGTSSDWLLDVIVDWAWVDWGPYRDSHEYSLLYTSPGGLINVGVIDTYYEDNIGALTVRVYRLP